MGVGDAKKEIPLAPCTACQPRNQCYVRAQEAFRLNRWRQCRQKALVLKPKNLGEGNGVRRSSPGFSPCVGSRRGRCSSAVRSQASERAGIFHIR